MRDAAKVFGVWNRTTRNLFAEFDTREEAEAFIATEFPEGHDWLIVEDEADSDAAIRRVLVVRCVRCGHQWDDENPDDEVCACLDKYGSREVVVIANGATNV